MKKYDYLIVGAGLFGAVFAREAKKAGKKCLVIDRRDHRKYIHKRDRTDPGTSVWRAYFPYFGQRSVELCKPVRGI